MLFRSLGVSFQNVNPQLAKEKNLQILSGAYVESVVENSAAASAGIKKGDVITKINDTEIKNGAIMQEQIGRYSPGDKVLVTLLRDNKPLTLSVELKNSIGSTAVISSEKNIDVLGAEFSELDEKTKDKLNLPYGVEIKSLKKGKLQEVGVKSGFIIVKINNQAIRSVEEITDRKSTRLNSSH